MIRPANWNKQIKEIIKDFSDFNFQQKTWSGTDKHQCASPDEMCCWTEDVLMEEWVEENQSILSKKLQKEFKAFFQQIDNLPEEKHYEHLNEALLSSEWESIRTLATTILEQLEKIPELNK